MYFQTSGYPAYPGISLRIPPSDTFPYFRRGGVSEYLPPLGISTPPSLRPQMSTFLSKNTPKSSFLDFFLCYAKYPWESSYRDFSKKKFRSHLALLLPWQNMRFFCKRWSFYFQPKVFTLCKIKTTMQNNVSY